MQMGCIMRPYFRGNALYAQAASEGTTGRFIRGRSPHVCPAFCDRSYEGEGVRRNALRVLRPKSSHSEDRAQYIEWRDPPRSCNRMVIG